MTQKKDQVVLITGGSAGLGRAIALAFAARGAKLVLVARDPARLAEAAAAVSAAGGEVLTVTADITRDDDVRRMIDETMARFGRLDVLVNNAGKSARGKLLDVSLDDYRALWEVNFLALVRCTQAAAPLLIASRGHIVNIGSLASKSASRYIGAYATSKFPVAAFSQQLRLELADAGVHVLLVCPGPIHRDDEGSRYGAEMKNLPDSAKLPGAGVKVKRLRPEAVAARIVRGVDRRELEIVMPWKARILFTLSQWSPSLGDWLVRKMT
jgi:short-subunit dehydrogenase